MFGCKIVVCCAFEFGVSFLGPLHCTLYILKIAIQNKCNMSDVHGGTNKRTNKAKRRRWISDAICVWIVTEFGMSSSFSISSVVSHSLYSLPFMCIYPLSLYICAIDKFALYADFFFLSFFFFYLPFFCFTFFLFGFFFHHPVLVSSYCACCT